MSSEQYSIIIKSISKHYIYYDKPGQRLIELITPKIFNFIRKRNANSSKKICALNTFSLKIKKGETIGIMGRNGSGKSTLLKLICGVVQPSSGEVKTFGSLFPILELGSSFNFENTGIQNIYLNCTIHGFNKVEIDKLLDQIIDFADIGDFITMPIKTYSTGMVVRLAFAIAINIRPSILIVDEALAVGDEAFQRKCYSKIKQIQKEGTTLILVSHSSQDILQLCDRAIVLDSGTKILEGKPKYAVDNYQKFLNSNKNTSKSEIEKEIKDLDKNTLIKSKSNYDETIPKVNTVEYPSNGLRIKDVNIIDQNNQIVNVLIPGKRYSINYNIHLDETLHYLAFGTTIKNVTGLALGGGTTDKSEDKWIKIAKKGERYSIGFKFTCNLNKGAYFLNVGATALFSNLAERKFVHRLIDIVSFKVNNNINDLEYEFTFIDPSFEINNINND